MPALALQPATVPGDEPFPPANAQALINFVCAYLGISGLENLTGVVVSSAEPAAADRDKLWAKLDASNGRVLSLYAYNGGWLPLPVIIPNGETPPAGGKLGEVFFNTTIKALLVFDGTSWTTNTAPASTSTNRPTDVPSGYVYFDTTIGRMLRLTESGWTTYDGGVGDVKMVDFATVEEALAQNPGWAEFTPLSGRFPIGYSEDLPPQSEGGVTLEELALTWSAQGRSASGGGREASASFLASLTLNGTEARADGTSMAALTKLGADKTVNLKPPYKALIFLRKEF